MQNNFKLVLKQMGNSYIKTNIHDLEEGDYFRAYESETLDSVIRNNHVYQSGIVKDIDTIKEYMNELGSISNLISIHDDVIEETDVENIPLGSKFYVATERIDDILAPTDEKGIVLEKINKVTGNVIYSKERN